MGEPIPTLVAFGGTGNFLSSMTLLHDINLFYQHLAPSGVDTTYDLGSALKQCGYHCGWVDIG